MRDFHRPGRSAVFAQNGLCATSHPLAAAVALDLLRAGGTAADAAVGAALMLGLCEPHMCGIGGDCFAMVKPAGEERIVGLNGSGRAPAAARADALRAEGLSAVPWRSAHAVTIPGSIAAFERLLADWGRLGLAEVAAPAIRYAEQGVPVAPRVARDWAEEAEALSGRARELFLIGGAAPKAGDVFRAPALAEALKLIAKHGAKGFYEGPVAEDMADSLRALGGAHAAEDFAACAADPVEPISGAYRDVELVELPPNGHGATAILMARLLGGFEIGKLDPFGPMRAHLEAEAAKLAYDARNRFIADPAAMRFGLEPMLDDAKVAALGRLIDPQRALPDARKATAAIHKDTVYVCVVDRDGMAVSLIHSLFHGFGAGIASEKFGVLFQNRGAGFTLEKGHPNEYGPAKRPLHTIIPGMLRRGGRVVMPFGVMGGQYQPTGHVRLVSNMVDYGMDVQAAIDAPRSFLEDGALMLERGYDEAVIAPLEAKGHAVGWRPDPLGGAQAIVIDHARGVLIGGSDPRKDGIALGY
ncbi:MAG: gamma-glutamyltransferase family protein [Rubrimonas sp.]|uniref:gamma-glutamyltransferase family protein n=1 Tax=Rubrimonas sp. TaxID=2036015 RepID=UPI002FDEE6B5